MASAVDDLVAGGDEKPTRFGRYAVVRELGKGGMAQVFEGRHTELGSRVALKVMQPALAVQPLAAGRFLREAKAASQIRHPNVVQVFDVGTEKDLPFIVMEFVDGLNLATLLAEKGPLLLAGIVDIFLPVISAVATAHAAGIIHRDLKPANLMIARRPPRAAHPIVLDFGISKMTSEELEGTLTKSESLLGTVQYMAPELTRGAKFASAASDQYALGVMLYECATGRRPFAGASYYEMMHAIVTSPVAPPSRLRPELPPEFDALVERAMHRDPAKRFPSVAALGSALLSFGDRTAWTLWEAEFTGQPNENGPWGAPQRTLHDGPTGKSHDRGTRFDSASARRARSARRLRAALGLYAAVVTVLLARHWMQSNVALPTSEPAIATAASVDIPPSPTPPMGAAVTPVTLLVTPDSLHGVDEAATQNGRTERQTGAGESPSAPPPVTRSSPLLAKPRSPGSSKPPTEAAKTPPVPPLRAPSPETAPVVGTNGAPIVD